MFDVPTEKGYQPIIVGGRKLNIEGAVSDSDGDNISNLNSEYCELTALYWIWKNSNDDIVGLVHYRRYFEARKKIMSPSYVSKIMIDYDIIVPQKRNYFIASIKRHYDTAHYSSDLCLVRTKIMKIHPDYIDVFDKVMSGKKIFLYNMFVTKKEILRSYCEWLFPLINEVSQEIDTSNYDPYQKRVIGFLAERLFNVWVCKNISEEKIRYLPVINTDGEPKVKKAINFIYRIISSKG